jgi:hypothetical protein
MQALAATISALTITVWPGGGEAAYTHTLRCPSPNPDCAALARASRPFAPVPKDVVCTQIYGGPQRALVRGTYGGRRVWARFNRTDGCQIARWNRHKFLFDRR